MSHVILLHIDVMLLIRVKGLMFLTLNYHLNSDEVKSSLHRVYFYT